jgi:hypothetical protein
MASKSIRVLVRMDFPSQTLRFWDGAGPYLDANGDIWVGASLTEGLDQIEGAMNGEAATLMLSMSGIDRSISDLAYEELEAGDVIGAQVQVLVQPCDAWDQPEGEPEVKFTGTVDNMPSDDTVSGDQVVSRIVLEVANRFTLRTLVSGAVLSDVDQRARSRILNPLATALDRFCERINTLLDRNIVWPRFT